MNLLKFVSIFGLTTLLSLSGVNIFPVQAQVSVSKEIMLLSQAQFLRVNIGRGTVLEYNGSSGTGVFRDINSEQIINTISGFRKTWSHIVYLGDDRIFFYDRQTGEGEIYTVKQRRGELPQRLSRATTFRKTWKEIYSPRPGYLTFVDINGDVETYFVDKSGNLQRK
jgi:hypothetical protein